MLIARAPAFSMHARCRRGLPGPHLAPEGQRAVGQLQVGVPREGEHLQPGRQQESENCWVYCRVMRVYVMAAAEDQVAYHLP